MTTVLRQRIVMAQSLTSLSGLALKLLAFILYLAFKRCHEMNVYFFLFTFLFMNSSFPPLCAMCSILNEHEHLNVSCLEMVTVISPSGHGSHSSDPHQSLTLGPCSHLEISRDMTATPPLMTAAPPFLCDTSGTVYCKHIC